MGQKHKTIEYGKISITVTEATILQGMKRTRLKMVAVDAEITDPDRGPIAMVLYPDLMAAAVSFRGTDEPTLEMFEMWPEQLINLWGEAAYELNPHWLMRETVESAEKKAPISMDG